MKKPKKAPLPHQSAWITRFDQFADYTSIVGFRLLRSDHPRWLRLLTFVTMVAFSGMVVFQTREAFQRFVNPASKPVPRFESTQWEPIPRPGLVICTEKQVASVMRGYGSVDFRMLLSEYAKDNPDLSIFDRVQLEFGMLERLLNGTPTEEAITEVRKELTHFKELAMFLDFETFDADPNSLLTTAGYRIFRKRQFSFDECWREHRQRTEDRARFVECRLEKMRRRFAEFQHANENFFDYFFNVSLKFEDMIWNISFIDATYETSTYWHPAYGPCVLMESDDPDYNQTGTPQDNRLLSKPIELFSGEYLEIELTGFEEFQNELCTNRYPSVCSRFQRASTAYSYDVCRWCDAWIKTCTCAVPQSYHADVTIRKCTFFEAVRCTHRYKQSACESECRRQKWTLNTRQQPLELAHIPEFFQERMEDEFQRLTRALNAFFEFPYASTMRIFNTAEELYPFLEPYFKLFQLIYRIGYGNNFTMPVVFAENAVDSPSLATFLDVRQAPLNTCGMVGVDVVLERFLYDYFTYFRQSSFQPFFNCTRSIPLTSCARLLGDQVAEIPALMDLMESPNVNGTINPASFVRKYFIPENVHELSDALEKLQTTGRVLQFAVNRTLSMRNESESDACLEDLAANLNAFLTNDWIVDPQRKLEALRKVVKKGEYLSIRNMILIVLRYVPFTKQRVTYPADYNFWTFLAEFGGVLGLYFGVTIITLYETVVFFLSEPDEARVRRPPERKFSKSAIYEMEETSDYALAVPK